jgi:hypothetical protein
MNYNWFVKWSISRRVLMGYYKCQLLGFAFLCLEFCTGMHSLKVPPFTHSATL